MFTLGVSVRRLLLQSELPRRWNRSLNEKLVQNYMKAIEVKSVI